jgi:hypothetical protein
LGQTLGQLFGGFFLEGEEFFFYAFGGPATAGFEEAEGIEDTGDRSERSGGAERIVIRASGYVHVVHQAEDVGLLDETLVELPMHVGQLLEELDLLAAFGFVFVVVGLNVGLVSLFFFAGED